MLADEDLQRHAAENLEADALLFGRVTYETMGQRGGRRWGRERGLMSTSSWCSPGWRAMGPGCSRGYRSVLSKLARRFCHRKP